MSFRFDCDPALDRILVWVSGLWTVDITRKFARAAGAKAREVRAISDEYDILIDSRDFPVQAQDVAMLLPGIANAGLALTSGRAASVVGSQLNRFQAERTQTNPRFRIFMTMPDAIAWLAERPLSETKIPA